MSQGTCVERRLPGWHELADFHVHVGFEELSYEDPARMYSCEVYPYRTTLFKETNEPWKVFEYNCLYAEKENPFDVLPVSEAGTVLTIVTKNQIAPNMVGRPYEGKFRQQFEEATTDYWRISDDGMEVIRYHFNPRRFLFRPEDGPEIPVALSNLTGKPTTYGECYLTYETFEDLTSFSYQEEQIAQNNGEDQEPFHLAWTGQTRFELKEYVQPDSLPVKKKAKLRILEKAG